MPGMRTPDANLLREMPERDRDFAARGDRFPGSVAERLYAAEILGRVIGHAVDDLTPEPPNVVLADTPADVAAAGDAWRWQAYAVIAATVRPAMESFTAIERLAIAAAAYPLAGL